MRKPLLKPVLFPVQLTNHKIILGTMQYGIGLELQDNEYNHMWQLITLLDGTKTEKEVIQEMLKIAPELSEATITKTIQTLYDKGFLLDAGTPLPGSIAPSEMERYSRSANYFSWIDKSPHESLFYWQDKLKKARVTILGVGGVGASVAYNLTALGVGKIHLVDGDQIEESNLNRQMLYTEKDLGSYKATTAAKRLQEYNSTITIQGTVAQIEKKEDLKPLLKEADVFILCADRPYRPLRLWTNDVALNTNTPWVEVHTSGPTVGTTFFVPGKTPCYACAYHLAEQTNQELGVLNPSVLEQPPRAHGSIAPIVSIAGSVVALDVMHFLIGIPPRTLGKQYRQSFFIFDHVQLNPLRYWEECPSCGKNTEKQSKRHGTDSGSKTNAY